MALLLAALLPVRGVSGAAEPDATAPAPAPDPPQPPAAPARYSEAWLETTLRGYVERYPKLTRLVQLGKSNEGRPIWGLAIGRHVRRNDRRPTLLLNGGHHGLEFLSIDMVVDAIEVLLLRSGPTVTKAEQPLTLRRDPELDRRVRRVLDDLVIWCVPTVNPDGAWAALHGNPRTGRKNGRDTDENGHIDKRDGVDLNRNYPFKWGFLGELGSSAKMQSYYYRGPAAGSEPETQAMMRLAESEHFAASISYHTGTVALLAPYTIDNVQDPTPNEAWAVGEYITAGLPPHPQGRPFVLKRKIYSVDGTDQDYYRARFGTVALLVEGALHDPKDESERQAVVLAVRPTWLRLVDRFLNGPVVSGRVRDATGRPVAATVSVVEIETHEGESWHARCRDGRFDRFLPGPGHYTLRVAADGQPPLDYPIDIQAAAASVGKGAPGRIWLDVTLPSSVTPHRCPDAP